MTPYLSPICHTYIPSNPAYPYITVFLVDDVEEWLLKRTDFETVILNLYYNIENPERLEIIAPNNNSRRYVSTSNLLSLTKLF